MFSSFRSYLHFLWVQTGFLVAVSPHVCASVHLPNVSETSANLSDPSDSPSADPSAQLVESVSPQGTASQSDNTDVVPEGDVSAIPSADDSAMYPIAPHAAAEQRIWRNMRRPLDILLTRQLTKPVTSTQVASLKRFWYDGIGAATSEGFALSYIPLFAVAMGASTGQVGWLAAIGNLMGALALFPGARMLDRTGKRIPIVAWSYGLGYRGSLLVLALLPLILPSAAWAFPTVLVLNCVRTFSANFANPSWTSLTADVVPTFMRGRYFSMRNMLMGIASLLSTAIAGSLIRGLGDGEGGGLMSDSVRWSLLGFQTVFIIAFITGQWATWQFSRITEPPMPRTPKGEAPERRPVREILQQSPALRGFIAAAFLWTLGINIASPYFNVYMVTHLGGNEAIVGYTAAISGIFTLLGQFVFGKLLDRKGSVWVFVVSGVPIIFLPILWSFYTNAWQVGWNNVLGGFFWAGYNLANFNLLLMLTPDDQRARAVALYQTVVFTSAVIGPIVGGYVAENIDYKLIFWLSALGRLLGLLTFLALGLRAAIATEQKLRVV